MKKNIIILILLLSIFGCGEIENTADMEQTDKTEKSMQEANRQVGMPAIVNFQERKLMKMILELRDKSDLVRYAYIITMNGTKVFLGKCIGYGLPYSVQYTNPMKRLDGAYRGELTTIPQPDPNGLFMPDGLSATWLMMINPKTGEIEPLYVENEIIVSPFPLH